MTDAQPSPPRRRSRAVPGLDRVVHACAALADPIRLRILALLRQGEVCVCDIHGSLGVPQPTASRHLAYLRRHGLVVGRKDGQWVHYRAVDDLPPLLQRAVEAVVHCARHTLEIRGDGRHRVKTPRGRSS